jgi:cytochrome P450
MNAPLSTPPPVSLDAPFPWGRRPFDPPEEYRRLRAECPVRQVSTGYGQKVWLISRYDDVRAVLRHPGISADTRSSGFPQLSDAPVNRADRTFVRMDAPEHTVIRRLLSKKFLVREIAALEPLMRASVHAHIDAMLASETRQADLVRDLALPIPAEVIARLLGVPTADIPFFTHASEEIVEVVAVPGASAEALARAHAATVELRSYIADLARHQATLSQPEDSCLGLLVGAHLAGEITFGDVINTAFVLLIAGHDTVASMISMGTLTLLNHPEQHARLRDRPDRLPSAIEELLRYLTVVHLVILRVAREDVDLGGTTIRAGDGVIPLNFSADRDEQHYANPDVFDIERGTRDHLAFGQGPHHCIGHALARLELQVTFGALLERMPSFRLAGPMSDLRFRTDSSICGVVSLPVEW